MATWRSTAELRPHQSLFPNRIRVHSHVFDRGLDCEEPQGSNVARAPSRSGRTLPPRGQLPRPQTRQMKRTFVMMPAPMLILAPLVKLCCLHPTAAGPLFAKTLDGTS